MKTATDVPPATRDETGNPGWDQRIGGLLANLSAVQGDLLGLLDEKRVALGDGNYDALDDLTRREQVLIQRLEACQADRQALLVDAAREGLPAGSVQSLAQALPAAERTGLQAQVHEAQRRSRLLQHHSLTNWVAVQRTLIHLSQMVEIIATGGRMQPIYGKTCTNIDSGSLVDQQA